MKLSLDEFIAATHRLHAASVKKTRLMLKLRPQSTAAHRRRIFILKSTDGSAVYTTGVGSIAELRRVEALVNDFVTACTKDLLPHPPLSQAAFTSTSATPSNNSQQQQQQQQPQQAAGGGGTASGKSCAPGSSGNQSSSNSSKNQGKQQQQQQQGGGGKGGKKGKR